jgi:histidinol-phosphate aminotransferase
LGPSPKALAAVRKNLSSVNRYPDSGGFYLKRKLARFCGLEPANIILGNGSDELIEIIVKAFVEGGEEVITADFAFLEYKIISAVNNLKVLTAPLKYFRYDLSAMRARISQMTKVVFIANPNNPTGTYVSKYELEEFLRVVPERVLVVLDEAYDAFIDADDFPNSLSYLRRKNLIVLKTFSKAYGLAGLRIGYALGNAELISCMEKARQPFNVNSLAQVAAAAALDDREFLKLTRKVILEGKEYIYRALTDLGIAYLPSAANFILIDVGRDGFGVFKEMLKFGVIVRDMRQYGLKNFIRVTIGTKRENERFVCVLKKVLRQR